MRVSYLGTAYSGFQTQLNADTVQDQIEKAIHRLTGDDIKIHSSGRTDKGVHARGQVFHFHTKSIIPIKRWRMALNARLPDDIVIEDVNEVPLEFHARRSAKRKTYRYRINTNLLPNIFTRFYEFHHPAPLLVDEMRIALQFFVGTHDFTSFCSLKSDKDSHERTIYEASLEFTPTTNLNGTSDRGIIEIYLTGNGFLYNMVRIIVGTLIEIGEGKKNALDVPLILQAKNRSLSGPTAVAGGLTLWHVEYSGEQEKQDHLD